MAAGLPNIYFILVNRIISASVGIIHFVYCLISINLWNERKATLMRLVPTKFAPEKAVLAEALYDDSGHILVDAGAPLTPELIEKINQNHIYSVYIKDQHSRGELPPLIDPLLRQKACGLVKNIFDRAGNRMPDGTHAPLPILGIMPELSRLMDDILYEMRNCRDKQLEYIAPKSVIGYLYSSAVDVAMLSVLIGWELGLSNEMVYQLFLGGIFHDIGMAMLPKEIVYKKEALSIEDKRHVMSHPLKGCEYLKDKSFLSSYVRAIVLEHHENIDGTGYPNGKKGEELHILTQIVGLSDIFDAMTSDRPYRQALPAHEALEYIMTVADKHFDKNIVKAFVRKINPYPAGSLVRLKDGRTAVVRKGSPGQPLRPQISIIRERDGGFEYEDVDLQKDTALDIEGIQY